MPLPSQQQDDEAEPADDRRHQHDPLVAAGDGEGGAAVAGAHREQAAMVDRLIAVEAALGAVLESRRHLRRHRDLVQLDLRAPPSSGW